MADLSPRKEVKELIRTAEKQGWKVEKSGNGHIRFYPPDSNVFVSSPSTASEYRSMKNVRAKLKRAGLNLNPNQK